MTDKDIIDFLNHIWCDDDGTWYYDASDSIKLSKDVTALASFKNLLLEAQKQVWQQTIDANTRKPTHGNCCTCQSCGQYHDDCTCEIVNYAKDRLAELQSQLGGATNE
jgi:hypothetical protein